MGALNRVELTAIYYVAAELFPTVHSYQEGEA